MQEEGSLILMFVKYQKVRPTLISLPHNNAEFVQILQIVQRKECFQFFWLL